jgi:hypothetical protein
MQRCQWMNAKGLLNLDFGLWTTCVLFVFSFHPRFPLFSSVFPPLYCKACGMWHVVSKDLVMCYVVQWYVPGATLKLLKLDSILFVSTEHPLQYSILSNVQESTCVYTLKWYCVCV